MTPPVDFPAQEYGQVATPEYINAVAAAVEDHDAVLRGAYAVLTRTTDYPVAAGAEVPIPWQAIATATPGTADLANYPMRLTVPAAGTYVVSAAFALQDTSTGLMRAAHIRLSGGIWLADQRYNALPSNHAPFTLTAEFDATPGAYVEVLVFHGAAGPLNFLAAGAVPARFSLRRVR
ncbi:hypothetical protein [Longispora albida]|uniref:hypothetical protein n=1 Tax=Longispora albida TaxID=203523 RepID=UPI0003649931|nr:hypothetical protein [Longispora albida]